MTITDRGPHPRLSRAIDLSEAAAIELDYIHEGLASVFIIPLRKQQFESAEITAQLIEPSDAPRSRRPAASALGRLGRSDTVRGSIQVNRQAEWWLDVEIEPCNFFERAVEDGAAAGFQRDDERQGGMRVSGLLQQGVNADAVARKHRRDLGDDAGAVANHQTQIVRHGTLAAHAAREPARAVRERPDRGAAGPRNRVQI